MTGQVVKDKQGREVFKFTFDRPTCESCPRFKSCVHSKKTGRTVTTHAHEALLQQARARQQEAGFKALYNLSSAVERIIGELVYHGLRRTRHIGERKRRLRRLWTAAAINLKRLFTLDRANHINLEAVIAAMA